MAPVRVKDFGKRTRTRLRRPPPVSKASPMPASKTGPATASSVKPAIIAVSAPPVEEPTAAPEEPGAAPAYEPDFDEMRVWKRQNWKWTLYEKSGLLKDETPTEEE